MNTGKTLFAIMDLLPADQTIALDGSRTSQDYPGCSRLRTIMSWLHQPSPGSGPGPMRWSRTLGIVAALPTELSADPGNRSSGPPHGPAQWHGRRA